MLSYIEDIVTALYRADQKGKDTKSSAAPKKCFVVNEDFKKLDQKKVVDFHNIVAKNLYATKRERPDTCTSIAFQTTWVQAPDEDYWAKLVHMMRYLRGTRNTSLTLSDNGSGILKWWVDASFAVHPNMQGNPVGVLSLGRGFPIVIPIKQKIHTKSSTET